MTQRPDNTNGLDPFGIMRTMRDANLEAWSRMMQEFVNSEAYARTTGAMLDTYLTTSAPFRRFIEQTMTQVLTQFNMPTRADVISIAERLTNIEMRLDDLDAQLTAMTRTSTASQSGREEQASPEQDVQPTVTAATSELALPRFTEEGAPPSPTELILPIRSELQTIEERAEPLATPPATEEAAPPSAMDPIVETLSEPQTDEQTPAARSSGRRGSRSKEQA